ncbi:hypothetical protein HDU96_000631 [Phlyctochytrium bullatum]|nr:hypothetical protein HDU96_000631 [Phlyctochytrium bullatum]
MARRQNPNPASQARRNPCRGAAASSEPMSEPGSKTTTDVAAPRVDAAPPDTAGLLAPDGSSASVAAAASSSSAAPADAEEEVPLTVTRPRSRGPSVSFASVSAAAAASQPLTVTSSSSSSGGAGAATSAGGGGFATSAQPSAPPAAAVVTSSPSRRRSAANSDLALVLQAMSDNNRLLLEGIRADNRLLMDSMRDRMRDGIREGVRAVSDLFRDECAPTNPSVSPPCAVPSASSSCPGTSGMAASAPLPPDDEEGDYVDQFIASGVRPGNQLPAPPPPPRPPLSRPVDGARVGSAVASTRGDPPAALTARLKGCMPGARAASLGLWFETFMPEQIADLRLMTAEEANAAAFGATPRRATPKNKTGSHWFFPLVLAASQAVRNYSDRVLVIWNDPRMVPRSCSREVLIPTIQANLAAFANRIALMASSLGSAELHTLAACTAFLAVMEEAWQDPSTAREYAFPLTFVEAAVKNGPASARIIYDACQTYVSQPSGSLSGKRAAGDFGGPSKKFKSDQKEKGICKKWNNGGCKDVCEFGCPHCCHHCNSTEHRAVECRPFEEAKARFLAQKKLLGSRDREPSHPPDSPPPRPRFGPPSPNPPVSLAPVPTQPVRLPPLRL